MGTIARALILTATVWLVVSPAVMGQHSGDGSSGAVLPGKPDARELVSLGEKVRKGMRKLGAALARGDLPGAASSAEPASRAAFSMGRVAVATMGINGLGVKELNTLSKQIGGKLETIRKAALSGDGDGALAAWSELREIDRRLDELLPSPPAPTIQLMPPGGGVRSGEAAMLKFRARDEWGRTLTTFDLVEGFAAHALVVSQDLGWFTHERLEPGADGSFEIPLTFPSGGTYGVFAWFKPAGSALADAHALLKVEGQSRSAGEPPAPDADRAKEVSGLRVAMQDGRVPVAGGSSRLVFQVSDVRDASSIPRLEPVAGLPGYFVAISADMESVVRTRPVEGTGAGGRVEFEGVFEDAGLYRGWLEVRRAGEGIVVPFTFEVARAHTR